MSKKIFILLALFCATLPMAAEAAVWQLGTTVNNSGGNIVIRNAAPLTVANGTVFKSYTTHANIPVTVNANTGYQISTVKVNGVAKALPIASGTSYQINIANGVSQTLSASFKAQQVAVSASGGPGGTVSPTGSWTYSYGTQTYPIIFTFTPYTGNNVIDITGLPASGYTLTDASTGAAVTLPAATNQKVKVTITSLTAPVSLSAAFVSVVANAGAPQYVLPGATVTLNASATTPGDATFTWTQTAGPATVTLSST